MWEGEEAWVWVEREKGGEDLNMAWEGMEDEDKEGNGEGGAVWKRWDQGRS